MEVIHVMSIPNQITSYKTTLMQYKLFIYPCAQQQLKHGLHTKNKNCCFVVNKFSEDFDIENNTDVLFFLLLQFRYKMT